MRQNNRQNYNFIFTFVERRGDGKTENSELNGSK